MQRLFFHLKEKLNAFCCSKDLEQYAPGIYLVNVSRGYIGAYADSGTMPQLSWLERIEPDLGVMPA